MAADHMSRVFAALADPTRRAILARLATGEVTVGELAEPFDMTLPAISNHLRVLEKAGLIRREIDAQRRRCSLTPVGLEDAEGYLSQLREFWGQRFGDLETYLAKIQNGQPDKTDK